MRISHKIRTLKSLNVGAGIAANRTHTETMRCAGPRWTLRSWAGDDPSALCAGARVACSQPVTILNSNFETNLGESRSPAARASIHQRGRAILSQK